MSCDELIAAARPDLSDVDRQLIQRAYQFAATAHQTQKRKSGEPYFVHLFETALTVARWRLDATTIAAALLHDTLEDTKVTSGELERLFGSDVAFLVNGVTKISRLKYRGNEAQVETLKKMILALSEDIRVVFIKLADRLHNMRTLAYLPREKQHRIALETSEIYAPLAYRMGLGAASGDLADLAFPYLDPAGYRLVTRLAKSYLANGEIYMARVKERISDELARHGIKVLRVDARVKRINSLYKKLKRWNMNIDEIHDLVALRIIVGTVEDCYAVLGLIHSLWPPLPGRIKDYIALPKPNGYRSLHTTVICLDDRPTEFQITTEAMYRENEFGVAAHWAYNEAKTTSAYLDEAKRSVLVESRQLSWINQLKQWQDKVNDPDEFIASLKIDFFKNRIFVITPRGEALDLPVGATPIDFAYAIHSEIGDHCVGARVNDRMVPLDYELQSGDVVEILTQKNKRPNADWLRFVKTRHARQRIRSDTRPVDQANWTIEMTALDRRGLMKDVAAVFSGQRLNILSLESPKSTAGSVVMIRVVVGAEAAAKIDRVMFRLRAIPNIQRVDCRRIG